MAVRYMSYHPLLCPILLECHIKENIQSYSYIIMKNQPEDSVKGFYSLFSPLVSFPCSGVFSSGYT